MAKFSDLLKSGLQGIGQWATLEGRNLGQLYKNLILASRVKRVRPEDYDTEEDFNRAMAASTGAYDVLQSELQSPTGNAILNRILNISPEQQQRQSASQLYGVTEENPDGTVLSPELLKTTTNLISKLPVPGLRLGGAMAVGGTQAAAGGLGMSTPGEEVKSTLTAIPFGIAGGAASYGLGKLGQSLAGKTKTVGKGMGLDLDSIDDVTKIKDLSKDAKSALKTLSETAGFKDPKLSDSKNILNYLQNRKLAGATPGETLENMTQEFAKASRLKERGIKEIGGFSKSYIDVIKNNIDDATQYSALSSMDTNALNRMKKVLDTAPKDAKTLDRIAQDWYKIGLNKAGEQKMNQSGLYKLGAKAIRDTLKAVDDSGNYTSAMNTLSKILGLEDDGAVAAAAASAGKAGINLPMFQNSGLYGTDIKTPFIPDTISKMRSEVAQKQLGRLFGQQPTTTTPYQGIGNILETLGIAGQTTPKGVVGGLTNAPKQEEFEPLQEIPQLADDDEGLMLIRSAFEQPQSQGIGGMGAGGKETQALNFMLAQEILNGNISATEANAVLSLLGMGPEEEVKEKTMTESQRDYQLAAEAIQQAKSILEQSGGAGKLATVGGNIAGFFGSTTASSEYRSALETATAFLRKALIGSGQSASELKNLNLPKPTDEPNIARQKIATLIPLLLARAGLQEY